MKSILKKMLIATVLAVSTLGGISVSAKDAPRDGEVYIVYKDKDGHYVIEIIVTQ